VTRKISRLFNLTKLFKEFNFSFQLNVDYRVDDVNNNMICSTLFCDITDIYHLQHKYIP